MTLEKDVTIEGDFHHTSGLGFDEFALEAGIEIMGSLRVDHGDGGSETVLEESLVGNMLVVETGAGQDIVELAGMEVNGRTILSTGADADAVLTVDSSYDGSFRADGGTGTDVFEDGGGNAFNGGSSLTNFEVLLP